MLRQTDEFKDMFDELIQYERRGVQLAIGGKPASPTQIIQAHMVKEDSGYMRDYVLDEGGALKELCFYRLNE